LVVFGDAYKVIEFVVFVVVSQSGYVYTKFQVTPLCVTLTVALPPSLSNVTVSGFNVIEG